MPKGKKKEVVVQEQEPKVELQLKSQLNNQTEKEQLISRQEELLSHLNWLDVNKYQDKGQIEVALSQVNTRLTQI